MNDKFEYTNAAIILWSLAKLINEETYNCRFENWNYREPAGGYLINEPVRMHPMDGCRAPFSLIPEPPQSTININNLFRRLISEIKNTGYLIKYGEMYEEGPFSIDKIKEQLMEVFGIDIDNLTTGWDEEFEAKRKEYLDFKKRINGIIELSNYEEEVK
jgi:hypothetical protein